MYQEDFVANYNDYLSSLDKREQTVIKLRFGLDGEESLTLAEIGEILGLTRERVRQIEARALRKIRNAIIEKQKSSK